MPICLIMTIGNSALILGLWSVHFLWTNYCIVRSKQFGPVLKFVLCLFISVFLILWPSIGIVGSIIGGAAYGFLAPMFATFKAVNEGKTDKFYHCIYDGTSDTVKQSFTFVRDFMDICYHSYFSVTDDLRSQGHQDGKYFEISLIQLGKMPENALKDGEKERSSNSSMQKGGI
ncbi:unnamed protein product [Camellia sinensis]